MNRDFLWFRQFFLEARRTSSSSMGMRERCGFWASDEGSTALFLGFTLGLHTPRKKL